MNLACGCVVDERRRVMVATCGKHRATRELARFLEAIHEEHFFKRSTLNASRYAQLQRLRQLLADHAAHPAN